MVIPNPILLDAAKQKAFAFESLLSVLESPQNEGARVQPQSAQVTSPKVDNPERSFGEASLSAKDISCTEHTTNQSVSHEDDNGGSDNYDDIVIRPSCTKRSSDGVVLRPPERRRNPLFCPPDLDGKDRIRKNSSPTPNPRPLDISTHNDDGGLIYIWQHGPPWTSWKCGPEMGIILVGGHP